MKISDILSNLPEDIKELELENVEITADELELVLKQGMIPIIQERKKALREFAEEKKYKIPIKKYPGKVVEVQLGATKSEGGTREKVIKIGGQTSFFWFENGITNRPVITFDTFDMPISLPSTIKKHFEDVMDSPAEWAKRAVKFGADLVTLHLVSTDPKNKDTPPKEAAKTVEEVLQAIKVPLIIGGSGNPDKDPIVLEAAAEAASGERCLLASANLDLDYKRIAKAAKEHGHAVLSWTSMNINDQKMLNRLLFKEGLKREQIIQDPTTGALGYGLDYSYSIMERIKLSALSGDEELNMPISSGVTNAWGAREAWMRTPEWGDREIRGPLWEILTGLAVFSAGADIMMMLHPKAAKMVKEVILSFSKEKKSEEINYYDWIRI